VVAGERVPEELISDFIRPVVRSIPPGIARKLGICRVSVVEKLGDATVDSRWTSIVSGLEIRLASSGREPHDIALELLLCLGQALWASLAQSRRKAYWLLLKSEIDAGISGEIDQDALELKRLLLSSRMSARNASRLERYGCASFAGTAAEYIHSLWHDVTVRSGPDFLPGPQLRRRLELVSRWYPPAQGYRLFPR
jgi:hypothetical protein